MKRIATIILILLSGSSKTLAQLVPVYNVTSPEVANIGTFGNIPVGYFTGTPDVTIPLCELKAGKYSLPVSARYYLSSVKPDGQYGCLGVGWTLEAGGFITRSVNFIYDEKKSKSGTEFGYYHHHGKMAGINSTTFSNKVANSLANDAYDLCADEFAFSFCGYQGRFYMNPEGGWTVVSDHDIKVEFNENDGFINLQTLRSRIDIYQWGNQNNNDRFFNKFTLVTPDGCRYEFGGLYATEYSISYYNPNNSDLIPTTWKLSKIKTPDNRVIDFEYQEYFPEGKPMLCDIRYVPQRIIEAGNSRDIKGYDGLNGFLIFPVYLETITSDSETLSFGYTKDVDYNSMFNNLQALFIGTGNTRISPYDFGSYVPDNQYNAFFNINPTATVSQKRMAIRNRFSNYKLETIAITHEYDNCTSYIDFGFVEDRKRKLLDSITFSGYAQSQGGNNNEKTYSFAYDSTAIPDYFIMAGTDSWGYYNGNPVQLSSTPVYSQSNANLAYSKAGTLKEITYPTGGKTQFEYELNQYSKTVALDRTTLESGNGTAGGLRVKEIKTYNSDDELVNLRKYYYTDSIRGSQSSGILYVKPRFSTTHHINYSGGNFDVIIYSKGGFWPTSLNDCSPIVGYSIVFEELLDKDGASLGYKRYDYSNYDNDIYGNAHNDENYTCFTASGSGRYVKYTSHSNRRGKLLSEKFYDKVNTLIKTINYRYSTINSGYMNIASEHILTLTYGGGDFIPLGWLNKVYTYSYLLNSERDTTYSQTGTGYYHTKKDITYNNNKLIKTETEISSQGGAVITSIDYPSDDTAYTWMTDRHILSIILKKDVTSGGKTRKEKYHYDRTSSDIPYVKDIKTNYGDADKLEYQVNLTDVYGNPVEIVTNGMKSVLYWGMWGQQLVGRIDNISNEQAMAVGMPDARTFSQNNEYWAYHIELNYFRLPPTAHIHSYSYTGSGELESSMEPTGFTTYYKYDGLDRLREVYHFDNTQNGTTKRIMHVYDYQYYNEIQE